MWNVVISVFSMLNYFIVQPFKYIQLLCTQVQELLWFFHFSFFCVFFEWLEESLFLAFRPSLCNMVFSALVETDASLQITATSVLTLLAQQPGERSTQWCQKSSCTLSVTDMSNLSGLLLDSDIELAVDHLTRLLLTEEDHRVRSVHAGHPFKCGLMMLQQWVSWQENVWLIYQVQVGIHYYESARYWTAHTPKI